MVGRAFPRHGHRGQPLNPIVSWHMNRDREEFRTLGGTNIPVTFLGALASLVLGVIAVAFYANGSRMVGALLAIGAIAGVVPYMRYRQRRRRGGSPF
jgi:hypothetical protein